MIRHIRKVLLKYPRASGHAEGMPKLQLSWRVYPTDAYETTLFDTSRYSFKINFGKYSK